MKRSFSIMDENFEETKSEIDLYLRLSYFGKSIITEIDIPISITKAFYVREETNEKYPYQCRELKPEELEGVCWGSTTFIPPIKPRNFKCDCQNEKTDELLQLNMNETTDDQKAETQTKDAESVKVSKDKVKGKEKKEDKEKGRTGMSDFTVDEKVWL